MRTVRAQASWGWRRPSAALAVLALIAGFQQDASAQSGPAPAPGRGVADAGALGGAGAGALPAG